MTEKGESKSGDGGMLLIIDDRGNIQPPYRWAYLPKEVVENVQENARRYQKAVSYLENYGEVEVKPREELKGKTMREQEFTDQALEERKSRQRHRKARRIILTVLWFASGLALGLLVRSC